jgi:hypothetical protein
MGPSWKVSALGLQDLVLINFCQVIILLLFMPYFVDII